MLFATARVVRGGIVAIPQPSKEIVQTRSSDKLLLSAELFGAAEGSARLGTEPDRINFDFAASSALHVNYLKMPPRVLLELRTQNSKSDIIGAITSHLALPFTSS